MAVPPCVVDAVNHLLRTGLGLFLAVFMMILVPVTVLHGKTVPAGENDLLEITEEDENAGLFSDDQAPWETLPEGEIPTLFDTGEELPATNEPKDRPLGLWHDLMANAALELGYQVSHGMEGETGLITHYGWLGLETETLAANRYFIRFDGKLSVIPASDHRTRAKKRRILTDEFLREFYVQRSFEHASFSLGRRIIVWGKTDTSAITDIVSPRDLSRFVFVELKDARKGQFMATATVYHDLFNTFLFISPDPAVSTLPASGTRYDRPLSVQQNAVVRKHDPAWGDVELGIRCFGTFSRLDLAFMAGRFHVNTPVFSSLQTQPDSVLVLGEQYPRFYMVGMAAALVKNNVLLKYELAVKKDFPLQEFDSSGDDTGIFMTETDLLDHALGLEINVNDRWLFTMELTHRHLFGHLNGHDNLNRDVTALYAVLEKKLCHDTLTLEYGFYCSLDDQGHYHDAQATWQATDQVELKGNITVFTARDREAELWPYRHEDRVTLEVRYHFSM